MTDAQKELAKKRYFDVAQRVGTGIDAKIRADLSLASFRENVVGEERIPMFMLSFPEGSALDGFHFAFTIDYLLNAPDEELTAGLVEDIERQTGERASSPPWWKRIFHR